MKRRKISIHSIKKQASKKIKLSKPQILGEDLLTVIVSFLDLNDLMRASIVCKKWQESVHLATDKKTIELKFDEGENDDDEYLKMILHVLNIISMKTFNRMEITSLPINEYVLGKIIPNVLEELSFVCCEDFNVSVFGKFSFSHLKGLSMSETNLGPKGMKAITRNNLSNLEWIELDNCNIGREGLERLLNSVGEKFKILNLFGANGIGSEELKLIAKHPFLRISEFTVGFDQNQTLGSDAIEIMAKSSVFQSLTKLTIDFFGETLQVEESVGKLFSEFSNLRSLQLYRKVLFTNEGVKEFCKILPRLTKLKLDILKTESNTLLLSRVELFNLRSLFIRNNVDNFLKSNRTLSNLQKLDLSIHSGDELLIGLTKNHFPKLEHLTVQHNQLTEFGLKTLLECDAICSNLCLLDISFPEDDGNRITVSGNLGQLIAKSKLSKLTNLNISGLLTLTNDGAKALANADMPNLKILIMQSVGLEDEGFEAIMNSKKITNLRELDVQLNPFTISNQSALYSTTLTKLTSFVCSSSEDLDFDRLSINLPKTNFI